MLMDDESLSIVTEETDSVTIDDAIDEVEDAIDDIIINLFCFPSFVLPLFFPF